MGGNKPAKTQTTVPQYPKLPPTNSSVVDGPMVAYDPQNVSFEMRQGSIPSVLPLTHRLGYRQRTTTKITHLDVFRYCYTLNSWGNFTPGCLCGSDLETLLPAAQCLPVAVQKLVCIARRVWHYTLYAYQKHLTRRIPFRPHCV